MSIFIALLSSLMSTQAGSHWVVRTFANIANVQLGALQGNLLTGLDIASVDYKKDELVLHAEKISFRWQPLGLFYTTLAVQSLSAENIQLHLPPGKNEPEPEHYVWPSLAQPLRIQLQKVQLRNLQIQQGDTLIPLTAVKGNLSLGTFHLRTSDLTFEHNQGKLILDGAMSLRYPYELDVETQWQFTDTAMEKYSGKLLLTGDIKTLKLEHELLYPLRMKTRASISPALHQPKNLPKAVLSLDWAEQALLPAWAEYLTANNYVQSAKTLSKTQGHIEVTGWLNTFNIKINAQVSSPDNNFIVSGAAQGHYDEQQKSQNTHIDKLSLLVKPVAVSDAVDNLIELTGDIKGLNAWQWNLHLRAEHFDLNNVIADWPSDLNLAFDAEGSFSPRKTADDINVLTLAFKNIDGQGSLRNLAVSARGELNFDGEHWVSSDANFAIGANQLMLKGQAGNALAVEWKINAPLLGQIDPSIRGSIISSGVLSGDKAKPRLQITAQIDQLAWHDYAVQNLSLKLNPQAANENYDLVLDATHIQLQANTISHISLKGVGTLAQHNIDGRVDSPELGSVNFKLGSSWQDEIWHGQWREFAINVKKMPRWYLASSTPMLIDPQKDKARVDLGKLCVTTEAGNSVDKESALKLSNLPNIDTKSLAQKINDTATPMSPVVTQVHPSICFSSQWSSSAGLQVDGSLTAVPINQAQAWFKSEVALMGVVEGQITAQMPVAKPLVLDAHLQTRDAQFLYQFQGGNIETYALQKGTIDAAIKNNQLNATLLMDWANYGAINADAKYNLKDKKVQGKFSAALSDLAPLESLLPFLNDVKGSASANINLTGSADKPEFFGNLTLANGKANLPKLGLTLKDIALQVNSQGAGLVHMDGQITSGDGTLMVKGDLDNAGTPQWHWQGNIFGANIRFIEQAQLTATVSPNLKLSANAEAIHLTGSTEIPWARTVLKTLPASATRVSSDVNVIDGENYSQGNGTTKKSIPFFTNVILYFGDDVRFKGFGLDTQLSGKVNVLKEENRQTFTTGFVAVGKGNYKAYGQDLTIERGRLIFQGPYDNPGLDIRAVRILDNGSAGLDIGGTLQHPKSSAFSIPASPNGEAGAMAMLITGKELSQSSQADAYALIGAIGSLGMDNGQSMTSDIAHLFRIDEITIKADKGLEQSALWMGKHVTPKLFIRYMVGLFDQAFSLGMSYQLSEKLRLEAESGKNQSLDVIYKIER